MLPSEVDGVVEHGRRRKAVVGQHVDVVGVREYESAKMPNLEAHACCCHLFTNNALRYLTCGLCRTDVLH